MKKSLFLLWCLCLLLFGCDKDKEQDAEMELKTASILKFAGPSTSMIEFTSSSDWELQLEDDKEIPEWLKLSQTSSGSGNNRIIVGVTRTFIYINTPGKNRYKWQINYREADDFLIL